MFLLYLCLQDFEQESIYNICYINACIVQVPIYMTVLVNNKG